MGGPLGGPGPLVPPIGTYSLCVPSGFWLGVGDWESSDVDGGVLSEGRSGDVELEVFGGLFV